ncbi:MAG: hypothetical protein ACLSVD_00615 [Eggerthellaceae bacterium]
MPETAINGIVGRCRLAEGVPESPRCQRRGSRPASVIDNFWGINQHQRQRFQNENTNLRSALARC